VERALIYEQQARLNEAVQLFDESLLLLGESRQAYRDIAAEHRQQLEIRLNTPIRYQLDTQWFGQYLSLASYDDLQWLVQAGPFDKEEQKEWDNLFNQRREKEASEKLLNLIAHSKQREFNRSLTEQRVPLITYPAIDIDDVRSRIKGFELLRADIDSKEQNALVRRLYVDKIEEHLQILRLVEATYNQDIDGVQKYNELLYSKPTIAEMAIALQEFFNMLRRGLQDSEASSLSEELFKQLRQWKVYLEDFPKEEQKSDDLPNLSHKELLKKSLSPMAVQHFFEEVLSEYQFTEWQAVSAPERDNTSLDLDLCKLYLPVNGQFSMVKVCELLAEEIETHMYRSAAGRRSSLALLSSGTKGYLPTDEGLAIHYVQQMMQAQGLGKKSYSWITTLAPGMVAGVIFPAMNFTTLYSFLRKAFLVSHLLMKKHETKIAAEKAANQDALMRAVRTFRGVPDLNVVGTCNLKDRVYLQGYLEVSKKLEIVDVERLLVGSVGVGQLEDMADLNILRPAIPHRRLALDPDLLSRVVSFGEG